jgi:uncharacterized membrane protein
MGSTLERSFVKGLIWEFVSFLLTLLFIFLIYGNFGTSLKFTLGLTLVKIPLLFFYERVWKKIKWGKVRDKK